ncbi:alcohol dehydrogenase [NADP(+)] [Agrilus planipennis]|uniref:Alcohol dehydrogenase [NADP(+)] n=1 Tax=Agrilus planipennis TaxID=224129 RepID=A0A7F5RBY4_AGRPL|nr:alcohol dehydrogenase [NADP(+)] [Agrilus planipennis]
MAKNIYLSLRSGLKMPALGYGTWQANDEELEKGMEAALEAGYRHIDTAHVYENEGVIGKVIKRWLSSGKLDSMKAMEAQVDAGLAKAIGLSNFNIKQIQRILDNARIPPCNLQVELHAFFQQNELYNFCKKNNIVMTAYSPLGSPGIGKFMSQFGQQVEAPNILGDPVVKRIAKKHNKKESQVLLRHIIQKGIAAIPKSTNPERLKQNIDIFDFELDNEDMKALNALDKGPAARIVDFYAFKG